MLQGGGAATTDPRRPDYTNLYPMLSVDWDDPSVADLARTRNRHPVDIIIDLALENDRMFVQPIVNEFRRTCWDSSGIRGHWRRSPISARMFARKWAPRYKPTC